MVVKIPQLLTIINMQSAKGLSSTSYLLETLCGSIAAIYNWRHGHPFTTYGESVFLTVQNCVILLLILVLERRTLSALLHFVFVVILSGVWLRSPMNWITWFLTASVPIVVLSRIPQIYLIWKEKSRGAVNPITVLLTFAGSSARYNSSPYPVGYHHNVL